MRMPDCYSDPGVDAEAVIDEPSGRPASGDPANHADPAKTSDGDPRGDQHGANPEEVDREFDWRGWVLVGAIVVSFLVIPTIIVLYPHVGTMFGLSFWDAYLVLPMIPAVVLAAIAVWATTRP